LSAVFHWRDPFWQMVIEGLLIAGVVYLDNVQKRRAQGQ
jgi:ribose transport system permease protein